MPGAQYRSPAVFRWLADPVTASELREAYRADALSDAHRDDPEFGYRFLADEARDVGVVARRALKHHRMVGPMGRVGAAGDNAAMESFFSLLQKNVLDRKTWETREELRIAIVTWIERTYHRRRRQVALGRLTPIEYETIMTARATQAA